MGQESTKGQIEVKRDAEMVRGTHRMTMSIHKSRAEDEVGPPLVGCVAAEKSSAP